MILLWRDKDKVEVETGRQENIRQPPIIENCLIHLIYSKSLLLFFLHSLSAATFYFSAFFSLFYFLFTTSFADIFNFFWLIAASHKFTPFPDNKKTRAKTRVNTVNLRLLAHFYSDCNMLQIAAFTSTYSIAYVSS